MQVILLEDVKGMGERGDTIKVSAGYARNFLIPKKLAISVAGSGAKVFAENERQQSRRDDKARREAEGIAANFEGVSVGIEVEVGEEDRMFGSVTSADIADALKAQGVEVDKRKILLDDPIKQLGEFDVPIKLHKAVRGSVKVNVTKK
ncbi:MAG: 50S ribosomal protein L9 [Candidatus Eisenbacteria bacterium]|uniref:Large ribosomal subunit protein bL9 n=1 Tax=Eiseniibacteriota bacterium TaxID=2212470 RepID=A0A7Y2E6D0_UNCEI|nr:50S ribosomal protein L9 [Candidatus Eisenbacteria bacterium]